MDLLAYGLLALLGGCLLLGGLNTLGEPPGGPEPTYRELLWAIRWPLALLAGAVGATAGLTWMAG